jgi:3-carboxy-cis,cis-muconate cycloisomerase
MAETVNLLALITGSLGKIALDVMLMASSEFGELSEPFVPGRGASSTMPQKRNPISSELISVAAKTVRQHAGLMMDAMVQDFERATGPWYAEWIALPESFQYTAGALHQARFVLAGLGIDRERMRQNLGVSRGLIVAEAVMMKLAPAMGRQQAHDLVYAACRSVNAQGGSLAQALADLPAVTALFDRAAIEHMTDPANYLGMAPQMVDAAIARSAQMRD